MNFINSPFFNKIVFPISLIGTGTGFVLLARESRGGKECPNKERLDRKVVVVTGASSGIGKETAKEIARRGATVVMGCRHMGKCEKVATDIRMNSNNLHVVCRFLDLANLDSITRFAENIRKELPHVDILINNAGVMKPRPPKTTYTTDDGFERQFGVNHLGHFLLTNLLMDNLVNGDSPARIINITSAAYQNGKINLEDINKEHLKDEEQLNELYYQSKLANLWFTDSLHRKSLHELKGKISSNCLSPGVVDTNINRYSNVPMSAAGMHIFKPFRWFAILTPLKGAQTSIYLATDPSLEKSSGGYFEDCAKKAETCSLCDANETDKLWDISAKWTNLAERLDKIRKNELSSKTPS